MLFYIIGKPLKYIVGFFANSSEIGLGRIVCPKQNVLSQGEIDGKKYVDNPYVSIYGNYYKIPPIIRSHVEENQWLNKEAMESTT